MNSNELERIESCADWYRNEQLGFDKRLIAYRFESIRPYFVGRQALELGCAEGEMTALLRHAFETVTAVDGVQGLLDIMPNWENVVKVCSLFEAFETDLRYDTIVMEHILEHIEDPADLLQRVTKWLASSGRILIGVPNANSIHRLAATKMHLLARPDELNERDMALGHRRVYTPELLVEHVVASGLVVERLGGVFLKPLSTRQIDETWTPTMMDGFFELGKDFPEICAEIFVVCRPAEPS